MQHCVCSTVWLKSQCVWHLIYSNVLSQDASSVKMIPYQQKEVIRPEPVVFRLNLAQPGRLIDFLLGWNTDVWHGGIRKGKRHADPLMKRRESEWKFYNILQHLKYISVNDFNKSIRLYLVFLGKIIGWILIQNSPSPRRYKTAGPHPCRRQSKVLQRVCRR